MDINDKTAIEIARDFLESKCADAAEPLWDLDDFGNPIYVDVGCATWVCCEIFEIQDQPEPTVERDQEVLTVTIQAKVKWSHWDYCTTREFYVPIIFEDENWQASTDFDWEDVSIEDFEEEQIDGKISPLPVS